MHHEMAIIGGSCCWSKRAFPLIHYKNCGVKKLTPGWNQYGTNSYGVINTTWVLFKTTWVLDNTHVVLY